MKFTRTDQISHTIGETGRVGIGLVDGEIRVRGVDGDEARATIHYDIEARTDDEADRVHDVVRVHDRRGAGILELEEPRREGSWPEALARLIGGGWRQGSASVAIQVDVPRRASVRIRGVTANAWVDDTQGELELRSVSGDLFVQAQAGNVGLDTVSGAARVTAAGRLALRGRTVSGDVVAAAQEIAESHLATVSGDIEIEGVFGPGEHRVETASGDLRLATRGAITVDVTGVAADVRSEVEHRLEGSIGHRRLFIGTGGPELRFRTMSGALLLTHPRGAAAPAAPVSSEPIVTPAPPSGGPAPADDDRMAVLRAVERGELDVEEALRRLAEATRA